MGSEPDGPPLTKDQIAALPDGTRLTIIWSGGNGPHDYTLVTAPGGDRIAWCELDRPGYFDYQRTVGPDAFVGGERYHARVWLSPIDPEGTDGK